MRFITPVLSLFLAILLDTAIIPVFYHGVFTISITFVVILCVSLRLGKGMGALLGLIGGLVIDITAGTIPYMTVVLVAAGALCALIVPEYDPKLALPPLPFLLRRGLISLVMAGITELGMNIVVYFNSGIMTWSVIAGAAVRSLMTAAAVLLICPVLALIYPRPTVTPAAELPAEEAETY